MPKPEGTLTPIQHEILDVVWDAGSSGVVASDIWQAIASRRKVVRTTVLNQVDRLEKRGWLRREIDRKAIRFFAQLDRVQTEQLLADQFVADYFDGSASRLVSRLFGGSAISEEEIREVQGLIAKLPSARNERAGNEEAPNERVQNEQAPNEQESDSA